MALGLTGLPLHAAGHAVARRDRDRQAQLERWIRYARTLGAQAVLMASDQDRDPREVPEAWMARTGEVLAVRARAPLSDRLPPPPSLRRTLYFQRFRARGPDQIPLPGQFFLERWVEAGGAALSTFPSLDRFDFVADAPVPVGDVLFGLAYVVASPERALTSGHEVVHLASLRGGRGQELGREFLTGIPETPWDLVPDRRPLYEVLARDAAAAGWSLVVDEPLADLTVWAGGVARPGAFTVAAGHALPATVTRLGEVVGVAQGRRASQPGPVGGGGSRWTREGFVSPQQLVPPGWWAPRERRVWVQLREARREVVRGVAAWVARARRP